MAKYQKSGVINHVNKHSAQYGFASSEDLHESLNMIHTANEMFADLPSQARNKFENDPGKFLDFVQDPENESQLFELGLSDFPYESQKAALDTSVPAPSETESATAET